MVGNMIGAGIFLLPATLASYGPISILGWLISGIGAAALAFVFIEISKMLPGRSGGPYTYTREGLGDFAGFLVAWGYWISVWCANAAILVALVSYLGVFFPILNENFFLSTVLGLSLLWLVTWINTRGIREAGIFQLITSILKIAPLFAIVLFGIFYIDLTNYHPFNISDISNVRAITATGALTFFAYMGLECATIPSSEVENPTRTIPRATYFGISLTGLIYLLCTLVLMGLIPAEELQNSTAPFADAARLIWGSEAEYIVAGGAVISTLGALNGWILIQGQIPAAIAKDKLFPSFFGRENAKGVPVASVVFSSVFVSLLMMMNYTRGLAKAFEFALLLSSMTALIAYLFTSASYLVVAYIKKRLFDAVMLKVILACIAFIYSIWAIAGSGMEIVYWGFISLIAGIPLYIWIQIKR